MVPTVASKPCSGKPGLVNLVNVWIGSVSAKLSEHQSALSDTGQLGKLDTVGNCDDNSHDGARLDRTGGGWAAVSAGPGAGRGVLIVLGAKAGTVRGPEQRALAAINGLTDFLFWAPDERPVEAS
jgi:hypothetical protein